MQDIHSIGGGSRLFGGGGGGDRRLRPHGLHHHQSHQALKCPRCDSLNTKFCYYNNYNLSQPRHFCKSCRRYWTKGGVLRNVPVGGGCRKAKRSSKPKSSSEAATPPLRERKSTSHSSSESSSLTATAATATATTATAATTEAVSAPSAPSNSGSTLLNARDSKLFSSANNFGAGAPLLEQGSDCGIFSEIGSFTSLITSTNETLPFGFGNIPDVQTPFTLNQQQNQWQLQAQNQRAMELKMQEMGDHIHGGFIDHQTAQVDPSRSTTNTGFGLLDWQSNGDHHNHHQNQGLFDLPNTVDQAYWSQNHWTDQDQPSLYLP